MKKRSSLFYVAIFFGTLLVSSGKVAADPTDKVRSLTSLYMSLTGEPAPSAIIANVLEGNTSLEEVAQSLQKIRDFNSNLRAIGLVF